MRISKLSFAVLLVIVAGCSASRVKTDGAPSGSAVIPEIEDAIPRVEPLSKYGNPPVYEVLGHRYQVMASSVGYRERGVASWYGDKFHGRLTSSREPYDMYAMTAAHKTLPLPTYVRVRNLRNDKTIVVRVNDRGPFVSNRIIDLSYAAAKKLDMIGDGTSLVEVEALNPGAPVVASRERATPMATAAPENATHRIFVQVGAFGSRDNAERRRSVLVSGAIKNAFIDTDSGSTPPLYRVRIGPIADVLQYDLLVEELHNIGIDDPYLIND